MTLSFSTKAQNLKNLSGIVKSASIVPLEIVTTKNWSKDKKRCLDGIISSLGKGPFIVRSSCSDEDQVFQSNAGAYLSILDVKVDNFFAAVDRVIQDYKNYDQTQEVLIQPMLKSVIRSGVAFSHDPNTCSPYRVINWSEGSDTTSITGGNTGFIWQQAAKSRNTPRQEIQNVIKLLEELYSLFGNIPIDCEFAITNDGKNEKLWLLQVRALILSKLPENEVVQFNRLRIIEEKISKGMNQHPFLLGDRTVYGVMPDWNPAEMIGLRPKPLARTIYQELITDSIWAYQRNNYGYRNLRSFPLMLNFCGLPFIDVRVSFNSFIPADLDDSLARRLVNYYIEELIRKPALHDKIEFEIVFSSYTMDLPERLKILKKWGFSKLERKFIASSLKSLTNKIIHPRNGLWRLDQQKIRTLNERREKLLRSNLDYLEKIYWLVEDTKRYGTLPFAGLARAGFIAVQMLQSLIKVGVFSQDDFDCFMESLNTISSQLSLDRSRLGKNDFLKKYGHLRPGTYDISSFRYDEKPDLYFDWSRGSQKRKSRPAFSPTSVQKKKISNLLKEHGLNSDPKEFLNFLKSAIELREMAKFYFTRNVSDVLSMIELVGNKNKILKEDLAFCNFQVFQELYMSSSKERTLIKKSIDYEKQMYESTMKLSLPPIISAPGDIYGFEWPQTEPNFVTQKTVIARVTDCYDHDKLDGAIVFIESADPGFDWVFSHPIAALVTAWGGANSHMAIRASEIGLPAVIGAGEVKFRDWLGSSLLHIDCAGKRVEIIR